MDQQTKPTNPKDAIGSDKLPIHLWPLTATIVGSLALLDGGCKYGRSNFREIGVRASIYFDAAMRHLNAWFEGEEVAEDSGVPHLGHALACIAILIDAKAAGKLTDDRMIEGGYLDLVKQLTPIVKEIKDRHAKKAPKHYTIADNKPSLDFTPSTPDQPSANEIRELSNFLPRNENLALYCPRCGYTPCIGAVCEMHIRT